MAKKRKKPMPGWMQLPVYGAIRCGVGGLMACPVGPTCRVAETLGRAFGGAGFNRKRLARAVENLGVAFPDWSVERRERYALHSYEHLFRLGVETAHAPRLMNADGWAEHLGVGRLQGCLPDLIGGSPAVLVTGHCGNWEVLGYTMALLGIPIHAIYRPLDLKPLDRWVRRTRQSRGLVLLDKFGAIHAVPRLMRSGHSVAFVADQNAGDRGIFVPFFGRLASAYKSVGLMAMQHDAPVLCGMARRLVWERDWKHEAEREAHTTAEGGGEGEFGFMRWTGSGLGYRIDVTDVIRPEEWKAQPDPLYYITARYRRAIEGLVRSAPEQYLWMHRYWKSRPRHEHLGREIPANLMKRLEALPWMTSEELARIVEWSRRDAAALASGEGKRRRAPGAREEVGEEGAEAAEHENASADGV